MKCSTTHHAACECREAYFSDLLDKFQCYERALYEIMQLALLQEAKAEKGMLILPFKKASEIAEKALKEGDEG